MTFIHGMNKTRFHRIWRGMKNRCSDNKSNPCYKNYGARGIRVCKKWLGFLGFKEDMYVSYLEHVEKYGQKQTTLDRVDNNKNYNKENCRWATYTEQSTNKRPNVKHEGETSSEAAKRLGGHATLVRQRLKYGWSKEEAFNTPRRTWFKKIIKR